MIKLTEILNQLVTGKPFRRVVYRGDDKKFTRLSTKYLGKGLASGDRTGFWFTSNPDNASFFGEHVRQFEITMKNPKVLTYDDFVQTSHGPRHYAHVAKQEGYDGLVILDIVDGSHFSDIYCIFHPTQAKLVKSPLPSSEDTLSSKTLSSLT